MPTRTPRSGKSRHSASVAMPFIKPQLATLSDTPPIGSIWVNESKYDGYRMQAHSHSGQTVMYSRSGIDWSHRFPEITDSVRAFFNNRNAVLDGEVVVGTNGASSFHDLQAALSAGDTSKTRYMVFDLLAFDSLDLRPLPLSERRLALQTLLDELPTRSRVKISRVLRGTASAAINKACARNEEGIICKRMDAPYYSGRNLSWLKVKCGKRQEFVIIGFSEPRGSRSGIGALLLGVYEKGRVLQYAGRVGTGFSDSDLVLLRQHLDTIAVETTPLDKSVNLATVKEASRITWVKPKLVAEVSFTEWTRDGLLRHPVFQGLREDKKPSSINREMP